MHRIPPNPAHTMTVLRTCNDAFGCPESWLAPDSIVEPHAQLVRHRHKQDAPVRRVRDDHQISQWMDVHSELQRSHERQI
jgi:hypothetical protein